MGERPRRLVAHTPREGTGDWHYLDDHLRDVGERAAENALAFGAEALARWVGTYHDLGKASAAFQDYLWISHVTGKKQRSTDHKGAGTWSTGELRVWPPLAFLIDGHHGGLPDREDLGAKLKDLGSDVARQGQFRDFARAVAPVLAPAPPHDALPAWAGSSPHATEFFVRMLFSALVDADHADTERHSRPDKSVHRGHGVDLCTLADRLAVAQRELTGQRGDPVNDVRHRVYEACLRAAELGPGFFRLTVPTGGGKTRSGLAFALDHALRHGMGRVIVAVPFLTITDQTTRVYRDILGDDRAVLEHYSSATWRESAEGDQSPAALWQRLSAEDWDAPVIVTTMVQLFESLFGHRTSACRKLHRTARSVIILDEAQTLPPDKLDPILDVLRELVAHYGTTVVLSTATQPALDDAPGFSGLPDVREIVPDPARHFLVLKRVAYEWPEPGETWSWERVADEMRTDDRALAVVNTKGDALALLDALDDPDAFHLSTSLCGAHRRDVLAVVRARLAARLPCRLVSTQVVEAGVDIDFPLVLRAMGPLDRIVQAAGRCNREGRLAGLGRLVVFRPEEGKQPPGAYRTGTGLTERALAEGGLDPDDPDTFKTYFARLFRTVGLDDKGIQPLRKALAFEEVARRFRLIEDDAVSAVVPYRRPTDLFAGLTLLPGDADLVRLDHDRSSERLIKKLLDERHRPRPGSARAMSRAAQPYSVSVRQKQIGEAASLGYASEVIGDLWLWEGRYDDVRGLTWAGREPDALVI